MVQGQDEIDMDQDIGREGGARLGLDGLAKITPSPRLLFDCSVIFLLCELNSSASEMETSLGARLARSTSWKHRLELVSFPQSKLGSQRRLTLF